MHRSAKRAALGLAIALFLAAPIAGASEGARIGPDSNLPVPRFVALRGADVNGRRGPGVEHRVDWVYQRTGLPLRVTAESGPWRRVRDPDGAQVWIHAAYLDDRRTVYVRGGRLGSVALRRLPRADAGLAAYLARGVVGELEACRGDWRQVRVEGRRGWVEAALLWGADSCDDPAPIE